MTNVEDLANQLLAELSASQRAELIERLLRPGLTADGLSPRDAGIMCSAGMFAVSRSLNKLEIAASDLDELGEAIFYGIDTFTSALDRATNHSEGSRGHGPRSRWERAAFDALNLRDHVGAAVRDSYEWSDSAPSYID
jgi:hypothetical protein